MQEVKKEIEQGSTLKIQPSVTCKKEDHEFRFVSGTEVECKKCPTGYPVSPGTEVKDGHIYIHGSFVI